MTKPKCKACHNKTYCASCSGEDAYALTVGSEEEPHKAKLLQEAPSRKRSIAALRTCCSQTSQPLEWGIHSSPTWMIGWPPQFNRRLQQAKNNIHMADYRSPIVSVRSQPLWHNVAIRSVFIVIMKRCTHLPFLAPFAILRRKHSNWQVINATATRKEVAGTDNGASCRLKTSIWKASHWTVAGFFFLIASERNKLSINHVLVFITHYLVCLLLNFNQGTALHNAKPWTHSTSYKDGRSALHVSFPFWKMCPRQDERNPVWGQHFF